MSRRLRILLPLLIGLMVSLTLVIAVFGATGTVKFIDPTDSSKDLNWARQGGQIGLQVTDSDLNVAVKRVLLPIDMTVNAATADTTKGSATVVLSPSTTISPTATTTAAVISPGDTVLIGNGTVRKVISASDTTGQIVLNKPLTFSGSAFTISKVTLSNASADNCPDCAAAQNIGTIGAGNQIFTLNAAPVIDSGEQTNPMSLVNRFSNNADTIVSPFDVALVSSTGTSITTAPVQAITASNGLVNVSGTGATGVYAMYWGSEPNDTGSAVTVTSQADPTGFTLVLNESGPTTGVFRLNILTTSGTSDANKNPPELKVAVNDVITLRYKDASPDQTVSATINVETTRPTLSNLSPSHDASTQSSRPEVEGDAIDTGSGVSKQTISVIFAVDDDGNGVIDTTKTPAEVNVDANGTITTITGGYHARQRLPASMAPLSNATIYWWLKATDAAGNVGVSDRQPTISGVADTCDVANFPSAGSLGGKNVNTTSDIAGCQPFSVNVDFNAPALSSAVTGSWWDTTKTTTDKTETDVTKAKNTSIRVDFSDNMDGTSFQTTDFKVDGITPLSVEWHSGRPQSVFLTTPALTPNARPKIELVGQVKDAAGNPTSSGVISSAADGIAPSLTVTITGAGGSRPVTTDQVTISIVADEDVAQPNVSVAKIGNHTATSALGTPIALVPILKSAKTYEATFTGTLPGLYNVYVTARDATASNQGGAGVNVGPINITSGTEALLFEIDTGIPTPVIGPVTVNNPAIPLTIDFSSEATEYGLDSGFAFTTNPANVVFSQDTHATTTIISATLDGTDITGTLVTTDDKIFRHSLANITTGSHAVVVTAKDAAGNQLQFTGSFNVTNLAPTVVAGPNVAINEGSTLTLTQTTFTDPNSSDTHTAVIDWGDGSTSTATITGSATSGSVTASHLYTDDGDSPYTVTVTVTDNLTASHTDSFQLVVNNVNPTLTAGSDQTINKGATLSLAPATFGDVGSLDTHSAVVVWGDGVHETVAVNQSAGTISGSHVYNVDGTFYPTIVVVDDDGGLIVGSFKATVGTGGPLPTLPNTTFGAMAVLTVAFIILVVWRRRQSTRPDGGPASRI